MTLMTDMTYVSYITVTLARVYAIAGRSVICVMGWLFTYNQ